MRPDYDEVGVRPYPSVTMRLNLPDKMFEAVCAWYWGHTKPFTYYAEKEKADQALLRWCKENLPRQSFTET